MANPAEKPEYLTFLQPTGSTLGQEGARGLDPDQVERRPVGWQSPNVQPRPPRRFFQTDGHLGDAPAALHRVRTLETPKSAALKAMIVASRNQISNSLKI
ncbi:MULTISPECIES: hypothetical protein [Alphaproteobacteria]|uniref:hypothetical protein n=1 Tax=Alphaproteobacteria TaxID=28211 RepID=UPI0011BF9FC1|nr:MULTISPECIES: hypothetical protein [Alphaproteobacteria]